jgi:hypothetical protein
MADEKNSVATNAPTPIPKEQPESPSNSPLGVYTSFDYSSEPFAELSEDGKSALMQLDIICTKTDVAARRFEVEQAWEALH